MIYRKLGESNLKVSVVGMGTWALGDDFWGRVDDNESVKAIQSAIDAGINLIDTAPAYGNGHSEEVVGKAVKGRREQVVVATKFGILRDDGRFDRNLTPASVRKEIDLSLERLGVDVIDLWQIHWPDKKTKIEDTVAEVIKIRDAGKFRYLGVSNFSPELMDKTRRAIPVVSLQPHYSMLERTIEATVLPYCIEHNIGILGYGTLAAGLLTGKFKEIPKFEAGDHRADFYPYFQQPTFSRVQKHLETLAAVARERDRSVAQIAINWTFSQRGVTTVLVGAKNTAQAAQNAAAGMFELSRAEIERIDRSLRDAEL